MDLKEFYQNVDVTFEGTIEGMGEIAVGYKKWLSGLLDDIVQRLPDEYFLSDLNTIHFLQLTQYKYKNYQNLIRIQFKI